MFKNIDSCLRYYKDCHGDTPCCIYKCAIGMYVLNGGMCFLNDELCILNGGLSILNDSLCILKGGLCDNITLNKFIKI